MTGAEKTLVALSAVPLFAILCGYVIDHREQFLQWWDGRFERRADRAYEMRRREHEAADRRINQVRRDPSPQPRSR